MMSHMVTEVWRPNDLSGPSFITLFSTNDIGLPGRDRVQKIPCQVSTHAGQDQGVGSCHDEIRGEECPSFRDASHWGMRCRGAGTKKWLCTSYPMKYLYVKQKRCWHR